MANTATLVLPALRASAYGGGALTFELPSLTLASAGHDPTGEFAFDGALPALTSKAFGGANASVSTPMLVVAAAGTATALVTAAFSLPALTADVSSTAAGQATAALTLPMAKLVGFGGAIISITLDSGITITSSVSAGSVLSAAVTLPLLDLTVVATAQNHGGGNLLLPALRAVNNGAAWLMLPSMQLTAIGHAVVTATFEAYALNLNHPPAQRGVQQVDELTRYTNFPFRQIVRYKNSYFGVADDALYLLEGTTDDGVPISWNAQTAFTDFDSPQLKTLEMAYFGGRLGPMTTITLLVSEASTQSYVYTTPLDDTAKNYRQPFGRGLKARYYAVAASGTDEVVIDSITFNIATLARKV